MSTSDSLKVLRDGVEDRERVARQPSRTYRLVLLSILITILAFNYVDRLALGLMLQDIKVDLHLSDTELGLLSGIAFALFYSVMGLPIARWADRGNRVLIVSLTATLWSVMVALCGLAAGFYQLMITRIGVAIGEAGCIPPAHSLIADSFDRSERPRAVARYMLGGPLSCFIGYFAAGWLNERFGWRATFAILGAPGLLLAVLAWFSLHEPRVLENGPKVMRDGAARIPRSQPSILEVLSSLWQNVTFRHMLISLSVLSFFSLGGASWQPTFFIRSFHLQSGQLGIWLTLIFGLCGFIGTFIGGEWASRHAAQNERRQLELTAIAQGSAGLVSVLIYVSSNSYFSFSCLAIQVFIAATTSGPLFATIQTLVPAHMRAMSIAIIYLFSNLIGMGLGPLAVGALSDALRPMAGEESLRYALMCMCPGLLWVSSHLWRASRTVSFDLNRITTSEV